MRSRSRVQRVIGWSSVTQTVVLAAALLFPVTAAAATCDSTWQGTGTTAEPTSGDWGTAGDWSPSGVPGSASNVCITGSGSYTVTVGGSDPAESAQVLTLGASGGSGTQTLDLQGIHYGLSVAADGVLTVGAGSIITASGTLELDSDSTGMAGGDGGYGDLVGGPIDNYGLIKTTVEPAADYDSSSFNYLQGQVVNEPGGEMDVNTGTLALSTNASITNDGTLDVDAGTAAEPGLIQVVSSSVPIVSNSTVNNNGTISLSDTSSWTQNGPLNGHPVSINGGAFTDTSGIGSFVLEAAVNVSGAIPAGQQVTVQGGGTWGNSLAALTSPLTNNGTLIFASTGGNFGGVSGSTLVNNGTIKTTETSGAQPALLRSALTNSHSGTVDVTSGSLDQDSGTATVNDGTISISPGATYSLTGGSTLTNQADGTLAFQIASAGSYGILSLTDGGALVLNGGTADPILSGGYVPASGTEFGVVAGSDPGTFTTVANGFAGDYGSKTGISLRYGAAAASTTAAPSASATKLDGNSSSTLISCAGMSGATCTVTLKLTVIERVKGGKLIGLAAARRKKAPKAKKRTVVLGIKTITVPAGQSEKAVVALNRAGRALLARHHKLAVKLTITKVVSAKAVTLTSRTLRFRQPAERKRK